MSHARRWILNLLLLGLLLLTWAVHVYHLSVYRKPRGVEIGETPEVAAHHIVRWIGKEKLGIHQIFVTGSPIERGLGEGWVERDLITMGEKDLITQLLRIFPNAWVRRPLEVLTFRWFSGLDQYLEPWMAQEMYGVAQSTTHEYDSFGERFTRQVQYHAVHEVGQMMIDQVGDDMGCTVAAVPSGRSWVIGRNFDFEAGRFFDNEKLMKWVFPEEGNAFISVVWPGMVGAVTAVNEKGVYLSLNAAGSTDFRRIGMPSTLVLLKALQFANTAEQAVEIIRGETMFITDIFVVSDRATGRLFRVEKSPEHVEVLELKEPSVVTNHLVSPRWQNDRINVFRRDELTSRVRFERGQKLVRMLAQRNPAPGELPLAVLGVLRDKGEDHGRRLHLGNRRAIDSLIAAHSVIFDEPANILYVSKGPGVSGAFVGFDLAASFRTRSPVAVRELPRDPLVNDQVFAQVRVSEKAAAESSRWSRRGKCKQAYEALSSSAAAFREGYWYHSALGDYRSRCASDPVGAKAAWRSALSLAPAYPREARDLEEKLK